MFCRNCGNVINEDQKFCSACGTAVAQKAAGSVGGAVQGVISASPKKKAGLIIGIVAAVALALTLVLVLAIPGDPADLLTDNTWYLEVNFASDQYTRGEMITFYTNGEAIETHVISYNFGRDFRDPSKKHKDWEVLENNVLHYGSNYYQWETEWYVSGSELRIGQDVYSSDNDFGYQE
ncbi:MAG: zinc ribbon domain-containing protein [Ruminococcaceae bacterium]|nr:zinc ribbon domain-containing protein [Oscillospiraceae bacterium]